MTAGFSWQCQMHVLNSALPAPVTTLYTWMWGPHGQIIVQLSGLRGAVPLSPVLFSGTGSSDLLPSQAVRCVVASLICFIETEITGDLLGLLHHTDPHFAFFKKMTIYFPSV